VNFQKRKALILALLEKEDTIEVPQFAAELGVSDITVRRDLKVLAGKGLIVRTHGGAMSLKSSQDRIEFVNKSAVRLAEKEYIARLAAEKISDGDIVFLDCGSTVFAMAPFLKSKAIQVITNSLPLTYALLNTNVKINLVGGEVDQKRMAVHGDTATQHIRRYKATRAFIGVDGVSLAGGLSSNSESEAEVTLAMAEQSEEVVLLCDSSKIEVEKYLRFAPVSLIDLLITDKGAKGAVLEKYRKAGIKISN
jgi:DeoR family transcriptional regulator, fructose operon transcriptional repressor